jgi:hypothetical protein
MNPGKERNVMKKTTWEEKLRQSNDLPKVVLLDEKGQARYRAASMVVPAPMNVYRIMAEVPEGRLTTTDVIRRKIAREFNADVTCPLTTGIFCVISANAAEEKRGQGALAVMPWWRTLRSDGTLNEKFPGGALHQGRLLQSEGHEIVPKGKTYMVRGFENNLTE